MFDKRLMHDATHFIVFKAKEKERKTNLVLAHGVVEGIDESGIIPQFTFLPHFLLTFRLWVFVCLNSHNSDRSTLLYQAQIQFSSAPNLGSILSAMVGFNPTQPNPGPLLDGLWQTLSGPIALFNVLFPFTQFD